MKEQQYSNIIVCELNSEKDTQWYMHGCAS